MLKTRLILTVASALALVTGASARLMAQGVTTGAVSGTVTDANGQPVEGAQVQLRNPRTGASAGAITRSNGTYSIQGVEPDPGYAVTVRRIGFEPQTQNNILVTLGQTTRSDFQLKQQTTVLETVSVSAEATPVINPSKTGTGTTVGDSLLRRLPTLNRNFADFVTLVPQVSTSTGVGLSGGGVNLRQNAIQIDGAASGDLFGLGTTGQPGAQANAKSIPLDAVKEYQVLLSPFDVRQGNFGGMLINAVTKTGTNEFHGATYGYTRNENLTRSQPYLAEFKQQQYGFSLGGPIIKNRLFFFVNPEWQKLNTPATGAFIGGSDSLVSTQTIGTFQQALQTAGLAEPGGGGRVLKQNPLTNVFGRIDAYLPGYTRVVLRHNYAAADNQTFSRSSSTSSSPLFNLTSNSYLFSSRTHSSVAEILTNLPNGVFNEFLLNLTNTHDFRTVPVTFPMITVRGFPRADGSASDVAMVAGTENSSQGNKLDQRTFELTENLTIPLASHHFTFGTKNLFYKPINLFGQNSMGNWTFASLAAFQAGTPVSYQVSAPSPTDPANGLATFRANMYSFYVQDAWQKSDRLTITAGVRYEKPKFLDTPPENPQVLQAYGRSTSAVPNKATISPRFSFNWDATGDQRNQFRGGFGFFTGPPPFVYLSNAFGNSGLSGYASLTCSGNASNQGNNATSTIPPPFNAANIADPPTSCAPFTPATGPTRPGATTAASSNIATIDPHFRFPQYQKITLGYDHRFANGLVSTVEGLYTKAIANAFYQNLALAGPQGRDRNGRVLYGTLTATGGTAALAPGGRQQVIDVTNAHGDRSYSLTGQLQKTFFDNFQGSLAYTYSQVKDVAATTSSTQGSNYRYQRDWAGYLEDRSLTRGKEDMPHRIVATGTWRLKTLTDFSVIYVGNSGAPYDYVYAAGGGSGSGDANADGQSQNDLVYVPRDAHDPNEILFSGFNAAAGSPQQLEAAAEADAFDRFIDRVPCLRESRGKILGRNTCRNPWQNEIDVSVGQNLRAFGQQNLQLRLDVINFANLLNKRWGWQNFSDQNNTCGPICSATTLLTQVGNVTTNRTQQEVQGIYTFNKTMKPWNADNASSNYRMQLSLRYSF
ncbi:MAG TPA: carboxypeptidase regulatory-like domain-containing protein [Gemmatimonadaceae bacterium]|nr:carboxypeptidase regulatory-like domain-containing protein [Gemmatimonadaceae bacterium]